AGESAARVSTAGASTLAQQLLNVARTVADAASEASRLWASEANPHLKAFSEDAQASLGIVGSAVTTIRSLMELRDEKDGKPLNAASLVPALIGVVETIVGAVRAAANRFAGEGNESIRSFTESVGGMLDIVTRTTDVVNQLAGMRQLSNYSMGVFKKNWESILTLLGEVSQLIKT